MASAAARWSRWSYGGRCRMMKCCGSENRAQACETHRRLRGPEGACATAAECKRIVEKTIMRDSSWPAVVELDVAVYRALRQRVIDLEPRCAKSASDPMTSRRLRTARGTDAPANRILTPRPRNTDRRGPRPAKACSGAVWTTPRRAGCGHREPSCCTRPLLCCRMGRLRVPGWDGANDVQADSTVRARRVGPRMV